VRCDHFWGVLVGLWAWTPLCVTAPAALAADPPDDVPSATPLVYCADLYHPHIDPDDHWDAATVYALAKAGRIDLRGIVIDYPPNDASDPAVAAGGDPAAVAVAQLNRITGLAVPMVVGSSRPFGPSAPATAPASIQNDETGARFILDALRRSREPVAIAVTGVCRNVALAGRLDPDVFRDKCRAVYVNAGTGTTDPDKGANTEYNVRLDVAAYRAMFALPCPVYWLPCFDDGPTAGGVKVAEYGSYWVFRQGDVLSHVSPAVQNYFLYALTRTSEPRWLRYLAREVDADALAAACEQPRNMWSTASFFHAAGLAVTRDGALVPIGDAGAAAVYDFLPIRVATNEQGVAAWRADQASPERFIIQVRDTDRYASAMTRALRAVLGEL
jgi:hypothetical protein